MWAAESVITKPLPLYKAIKLISQISRSFSRPENTILRIGLQSYVKVKCFFPFNPRFPKYMLLNVLSLECRVYFIENISLKLV